MSDAREWLSQAWWSPRRQDAMRDALLAVLDLHRSVGVLKDVPTCWGCGMDVPWPCPTVSAIDKALGVTDE